MRSACARRPRSDRSQAPGSVLFEFPLATPQQPFASVDSNARPCRKLLAVQHVNDTLDTRGAAARDLVGRSQDYIADYCSGVRYPVPAQ
jgi:hypothetical protein